MSEATSEAEPLVYGPTVLVLAARIAAHASTNDDPWTLETWRLAREVLDQEEKAALALADALGVNEVNLYALLREAARRLQAARKEAAELKWQFSGLVEDFTRDDETDTCGTSTVDIPALEALREMVGLEREVPVSDD